MLLRYQWTLSKHIQLHHYLTTNKLSYLINYKVINSSCQWVVHGLGVFLNDLGAIMAANEVLTCHLISTVGKCSIFNLFYCFCNCNAWELSLWLAVSKKAFTCFSPIQEPNRFWKRNFSSIRPSKMPQDMSPGAFLFWISRHASDRTEITKVF